MTSLRLVSLAAVAAAALVGACAGSTGSSTAGAARARVPQLDSARLMSDLARLAHDSMAGRAAGTPQNAKARAWLVSELRRLGVEPIGASYEHGFVRPRRNSTDSIRGANVLGVIRGTQRPDRYLVVSAHYDHVGVRNGEIYNGADDNASGTAAVLQLAAHFRAHPPRHSILIAFFDAEELGLQGARAMVAAPPVAKEAMLANVNLDMVSRTEELWAAGARYYPQFLPLLTQLAREAPISLRIGHDSGGGRDDWMMLSDQGAFHQAGVPALLFSVEDHPDYHKPTDDVERIVPAFYVNAVRTVAAFVERLDRQLTP